MLTLKFIPISLKKIKTALCAESPISTVDLLAGRPKPFQNFAENGVSEPKFYDALEVQKTFSSMMLLHVVVNEWAQRPH